MATPALTSRHSWLFPVCLAVILLVLYEPGRFENTSGDNISIRYWGVSVLKYGTLTLNPFRQDLSGVVYAGINMPDGTLLPRTTWGVLPLLVPVYAAADAFDIFGSEWTHDRISKVSRLAGIVWAIGAVVILYYFLLHLVSPGAAFLSALLFGTGTWNWSLGAQGAAQQVAVVMLLALNLHLLWRFCGSRSRKETLIDALLLGGLHAWIWSVRPQDFYLFVPVGLLLLERRVLVPYLVVLLTGVGTTMWLYKTYYGSWLGFQGILVSMNGRYPFLLNPLPGASGLLFSPNFGAWVFFPLLFLVPYLWWKLMPLPSLVGVVTRAWTGRFDEGVSRMQRVSLMLALGAAIYFSSLAIVEFWHGAWSYGPRYLYDFQPYLWVPIALAVAEVLKRLEGKQALLGAPVLAAVVLLGLEGVAIHGLGHLNYDFYIWNFSHSPVDTADTWDTNDWIIADTWRAGSNLHRWPDAMDRLRKYGF